MRKLRRKREEEKVNLIKEEERKLSRKREEEKEDHLKEDEEKEE